jgi:5-hydroxyisourate hydrolase
MPATFSRRLQTTVWPERSRQSCANSGPVQKCNSRLYKVRRSKLSSGQPTTKRSTFVISTHILDTSVGLPAANVRVDLERRTVHDDGGAREWTRIGSDATNADGRIVFPVPFEAGDYRLVFHVGDYSRSKGQTPFFPEVTVCVNIVDTSRKYHIPLLLNPFGYSTYRGS